MKEWTEDYHLRRMFEQKVVSATKVLEDLAYEHEDRSEVIHASWEVESIMNNLVDEVFDTMIDLVLDLSESLRNKTEEEVVEILLEKPYMLKYIHTPTQNMLNAVDMAEL